eukprot:s333_g10.t1
MICVLGGHGDTSAAAVAAVVVARAGVRARAGSQQHFLARAGWVICTRDTMRIVLCMRSTTFRARKATMDDIGLALWFFGVDD